MPVETNTQTVAERIADLRKRRGNPTQAEIARRVGCVVRSYQNWETGVTRPSRRNAELLAAYFRTSAGYILEGTAGDVPALGPENPELAELHGKLDEILSQLGALMDRGPNVGGSAPDGSAGALAGEPSERSGGGMGRQALLFR